MTATRLIRLLFSSFVLLCLLAGCGQKNADPKKATAERAGKALRKIEAATQVGVTLSIYRQLLIDAQVEVNESSQTLAGTSVGYRLKQAMICYVDAAEFWELSLSGRALYEDDPVGRKLISSYAALPDGVAGRDAGKTVQGKFVLKADAQVGVQRAWKYASIHIEKAYELLDKDLVDSPHVAANPS